MKNLNFYRFSSLNGLELEKIEDDAMIFVSEHLDEEGQIYFVRDNQFVMHDGYYKTSTYKFPKYIWKDVSSDDNGKMTVKDDVWCQNRFNETMDHIIEKTRFPYIYAIIWVSYDTNIMAIRIMPDSTEGAIHPVLSEYLSKEIYSISFEREKDSQEYCKVSEVNYNSLEKESKEKINFLTFLQKIKNAPYSDRSIQFMRRGEGQSYIFGLPIGLGDYPYHLDLNRMIQVILEVTEKIYETTFKQIKLISSRFQESSLTPKKQEILNDFKLFCIQHAESKTKMELVTEWANGFETTYHYNPFTVLSQHRRTSFSMFNPAKTDSIKLFEEFIGKENSLEKLMEQSENNKNNTI
jgi:hypothetical protein